MHALVAEAMKKAAIAWIRIDGAVAYPVWCLWIDEALYVVSGGSEQQAPGLAEATMAVVTTRGDHGGRIVAWNARAERVTPSDEAWPDVALQLAGKRLNSSGSNEALVERWAAPESGVVVTRLTPADDELVPPGDGSGAAPPIATPASRRTAKPFRLHRVRKPR